MEDLFQPEKEKDIMTDNNGAMSIRRSSFKKHIDQNKRNEGFKAILDENGGLPAHDEALFIKSKGCSDTVGIFQYMIDNMGICNEIYLSTWIISRTNIDYICELIDNGSIESLKFVISVRQKQLKKSNYARMIEEFGKRSDVAKYRVVNSHAKTFSARFGVNYYTVTGSGNWTKNPRIENYIVLNDKDAFDHNKDWMEGVING